MADAADIDSDVRTTNDNNGNHVNKEKEARERITDEVVKRKSFTSNEDPVPPSNNALDKDTNLQTRPRKSSSKDDSTSWTSRTSPKYSAGGDVFSQTTPVSSKVISNAVKKGLSFTDDKVSKKNSAVENKNKRNEIIGFVLVSWKIRQFFQLEKAVKPGRKLIYFPGYLNLIFICLAWIRNRR